MKLLVWIVLLSWMSALDVGEQFSGPTYVFPVGGCSSPPIKYLPDEETGHMVYTYGCEKP